MFTTHCPIQPPLALWGRLNPNSSQFLKSQQFGSLVARSTPQGLNGHCAGRRRPRTRLSSQTVLMSGTGSERGAEPTLWDLRVFSHFTIQSKFLVVFLSIIGFLFA